jgi:hypothetical protein
VRSTRQGNGKQGREVEEVEEIFRVTAEEARSKVSRDEALLVCAYEDPATFMSMHLEGAISLQEFRSRVPSLDRSQEIIFYCA